MFITCENKINFICVPMSKSSQYRLPNNHHHFSIPWEYSQCYSFVVHLYISSIQCWQSHYGVINHSFIAQCCFNYSTTLKGTNSFKVTGNGTFTLTYLIIILHDLKLPLIPPILSILILLLLLITVKSEIFNLTNTVVIDLYKIQHLLCE